MAQKPDLKITQVEKILFFFQFYLFLAAFWVFVAAARGLSLVAASRGYSSLWYAGFSLQWLLVAEHGLQVRGLQQLWHMDLVAPQHVGSSRTRDLTHVPCTGRQILNHCATTEVPRFLNILEAVYGPTMTQMIKMLMKEWNKQNKINRSNTFKQTI